MCDENSRTKKKRNTILVFFLSQVCHDFQKENSTDSCFLVCNVCFCVCVRVFLFSYLWKNFHDNPNFALIIFIALFYQSEDLRFMSFYVYDQTLTRLREVNAASAFECEVINSKFVSSAKL